MKKLAHASVMIVMVAGAGIEGRGETVSNAPAAREAGPSNSVVVAAVSNKVAAVLPGPSVAETNAVAVQPDPAVGKALMALATHLQSARNFHCEVSFLINSEMEGMKQEISATYGLTAERPNRLALRHIRGMAGNSVLCNGKTLVTYAPSLNRFTEGEAPKSLDQFSQGVGPMSGNMLFVDNLLRDDIYAAIMEGVNRAVYVGRETVEGVECDHLKFEQDQLDWEMWVSVGRAPLVIQVLSDMSKGLGSMAGENPLPKGMRMTVLNRFTGWAVDAALAPESFVFTPPAGAHRAESLFESDEEDPAERPAAQVPGPEPAASTNRVESK